ncbi:glycosyl transferase [Agarivorans sp. Toyoura001]|uniref:glycosyltransferase family 2 protein n=1 Tax=Agarivorans sp. Toyoura001 TaxID=2283141 RepID=UPI0010D0DB2F|nr:glycosyltransferase family A protein [Agarivorans sp. Toyoura001]GDY24140.1 glycosyl transferase [Agarivorans sp. Toyoura001]
MKITLIQATLGRDSELKRYIDSMKKSIDLLPDNVVPKLMIIDQNEPTFLSFLHSYDEGSLINHISSPNVGLSLNRNLGLSMTNCGVVGFPDDDCTYYEDTLTFVANFFEKNKDVDVLIGRLFDRDKNENILKNWPLKAMKVNYLNFYQVSSSATMFVRYQSNLTFDEKLGLGTKFGSCEDPDFIYRLIKDGKNIVYSPELHIWHPNPISSEIALMKTYSYASGLGAFLRKDLSFVKLNLLTLAVLKKIYQYIFLKTKFKKGHFYQFFRGLWYGFVNYR